MQTHLHTDLQKLGETAGKEAAALIRTTIASHDSATMVLGSDTTLATICQTLSKAPGIQWSKVSLIQLDELIGVPTTHKASHRKFLQDHFLSKLPGLRKLTLINGETIISDELKRLNQGFHDLHVDIAILGIGEHGEVGFNSSPADHQSEVPYLMKELDLETGKKLIAAGLYRTLGEVPRHAFTLSLYQLLRSKHIICAVAGKPFAETIKNMIEKENDPLTPASALTDHPAFSLHLDGEAASLLPNDMH